jgi:quercetin dioxygenase-like cupin family protein
LSAATAVKPRSIYHPLQRDTATMLESSEESGGRRTLIEVGLEVGGGNTLHRHLTYAERFEVLEGRLTVTVDGDVRQLEAGETATAPPGSLHCFTNETDAHVTFLVELAPGHAGFEQALQIGYGLAADGLTNKKGIPKSLSHTALLLGMSDMRLPGAMAAIGPVLRGLARRARRKGVERALVERYCAW